VPESTPPQELIRDEIPGFPELSEVDVVRHFTDFQPGTTVSIPVFIGSAAAP